MVQRILFLSAVLLFMLSGGCGDPITKYEAPAGPYGLYVTPELMEIDLGVVGAPHAVSLDIVLENVTDLYGLDLTLSLQNDSARAIASVSGIEEGVLLNENGAVSTLFLTQHPINKEYLRIQAVRLGGTGITTYESGRIATVFLDLHAAGDLKLVWTDATLYDSAKPQGSVIDPERHELKGAVLRIL